jgi:hypothetical protein
MCQRDHRRIDRNVRTRADRQRGALRVNVDARERKKNDCRNE